MDDKWFRLNKALFEIDDWNDGEYDNFHTLIDLLLLTNPGTRNIRVRDTETTLEPCKINVSLKPY